MDQEARGHYGGTQQVRVIPMDQEGRNERIAVHKELQNRNLTDHEQRHKPSVLQRQRSKIRKHSRRARSTPFRPTTTRPANDERGHHGSVTNRPVENRNTPYKKPKDKSTVKKPCET